MHGHYTNRNADELLHEYLLRREKMLRNRRYRDNIILFIDLLSRYLPRRSLQMVKTSGGLYESISKKIWRKALWRIYCANCYREITGKL